MNQATARNYALKPRGFDLEALSKLPGAQSLASEPLVVDPLDPEFAAPALTNQWSGLIAGREPFAYAGWSTPDLFHESHQGETFLSINGKAMQSAGQLFRELTYRWFPDRITREGARDSLGVSTTTMLSTTRQVVLNSMELSNNGASELTVDLFVRLTTDVRADWNTDWPPPESARGNVTVSGDGQQVLIASPDGDAFAAAAMNIIPVGVASFAREDDRWQQALASGELDGNVTDDRAHLVLHYRIELQAGASTTLEWAHSLADSAAGASADCSESLAAIDGEAARAAADWEAEWRAAFTRDGGSFSGYAPVLTSSNPKLARMYYMGIMTLLQVKRTPEFGTPATVYVTGFPSSTYTFHNNWIFPWDAMMVSGILSQLDPTVMKRMIDQWLESDLHAGCAVDFKTGEPVGFWYAVNDYAIIHMLWQYTRYTGDYAALEQQVRGTSVLDHLKEAALYYRRIAGNDGLADYGGANNLLECVSTYTGKVASFNAANVWNLRTVATMLREAGRDDEAAELEQLALEMVPRVQELYVPGEGYWTCLQPDGSSNTVRHCLDFHTVAQCMQDDLSEQQKNEMVAFFMRELKTETWMHALSPLDPDTAFSSRTDHQDEGAYTTWPAYAFEVLMAFGHEREAMDWLGDEGKPGFADVTNQGPFGQAYNHGDEGSFRNAGAGSKAPMEQPHIEKPVLVPGGKYAQIVIEAVAGIQPRQFGEVELTRSAPAADITLHNVLLRGSNHTTADGS